MTVIRKLSLRCPVCVAPFPTDVMLSADLFRGFHTDFLEESGGPETLAALVHTCPTCSYTGKRPDFDRPERTRVERIKPLLPLLGKDELAEVDGVGRWRLLGSVREIANDGPALVAEAFHCGAWCARLGGDEAREKDLLALALSAYEKALLPDSNPAGNHGYLAYQVAEVARRLGRADRAAAAFERVEEFVAKDMLPKYNATLVRKLAAIQKARPVDRVDLSAL